MTQSGFLISNNTKITSNVLTNRVMQNAKELLQRDIARTVTEASVSNEIKLVRLDSGKESEAFKVSQISDICVEVTSTSDIGIMYGVLAISRQILKIDDMWYFTDMPIQKVSSIVWTDFDLRLPVFRTKYRGWFVNDEVLLASWKDHDSNDYVWQRIYETLLRLGGNLIIPGTDTNSHVHRIGAQQMGLTIAHHHAEPLGAEMFARVYPDLKASYIIYPELFKKIWQESIDQQKGTKVIYNLGFRGQGDRPFWADDNSRIWDDQAKAEVINETIKIQYDMVKKADPNAECSLNVYGELTDLFNKGLLQLPSDVIEIWADNGYGKMVSRRQGENDSRSEVLKTPNLANRRRGIYYHIAFHDLQASNFLTLLPNSPAFVSQELMNVRNVKMDTLTLINTGNIKPHILFLKEVADFWRENYQIQTDAAILSAYVKRYYHDSSQKIQRLYQGYFDHVVQYGVLADQKAADEYPYYLIRKIIKAWVNHDKSLKGLSWTIDGQEINDQLNQINDLIGPHLTDWHNLIAETQRYYWTLTNQHDREFFYNDILLSILTYGCGLDALANVISAYKQFQRKEYVKAFVTSDTSLRAVEEVLSARKLNPSDKWFDFYDNDCYTDIGATRKKLVGLRSFIRICGDGANEDDWERKYLKETADARVILLMTTHPAYSDEYLARKLREYLSENN